MQSKLKFNWDNYPIDPKSRKPPYGWVKDEFDPTRFRVDYEMVPYIEQAMISMENGKSLRDVADWLTVNTGKPISHTGLRQIWDKLVINPEDSYRNEKLATWRQPKTREEKRQRKLAIRKGVARRRITNNKRYLEKLEAISKGEVLDEDGNEVTAAQTLLEDNIEEEQEVLFKPNPGPQTEFLQAPEHEVLYGGAAGGGKSFALISDPMRYFYHPKFNGLLLRRTNDELRDLINEAKQLYMKAWPKTKYSAQDKTFTFESGARLWFSYLESDKDVMRYQGQAFTWIGVDELTQYATPFAWDYLRSRLRTTAKDLPLSMRGTTNPGGPGHGWVKKMFIDPAPPNTSFIARDIETNEPLVYPPNHSRAGRPLFRRRFIPARLSDNPYLYDDGQYEASLLSLPEEQRRKLLDGDWSISQGAAFPEFNLRTHVAEPFEIPLEWRRFRSCDFGYSSHSAVLWFAIDPVWNRLIVYRELYVTKHTGKDLARKVLDLEKGEKISYGIMDSSVFHQRGNSGPVISEEMAAEGCRWRPSDRGHGSRIAGRNRLHELLKVQEIDDQEVPGIIIFDNCRQLISDLQVIPTDPKGGEDIDDRYSSDHTYDALRYGIMSRPKPNTFYEDFGISSSKPRVANAVFGY